MRTAKHRAWKYLGMLLLLLCISVLGFLRGQLSRSPKIAKLPHIDKCPNILLISIDTVRADHLSVYGYERKTAPSMETMASNGVLFKKALSQAPWTLPSVVSMHTSLYPSEHKAIEARSTLSQKIDTLAEVLNGAGYYTIGIVSHVFVSRKHGLAQGFDVFDETQIKGHDAVTSEALTKLAIEHINSAGHKPFFLWVHYFDPHFSYVRHPEFAFDTQYTGQLTEEIKENDLAEKLAQNQLSAQDLEYVKAVYDEEIAYTDFWIGQLLHSVENMEEKWPAVIILTADHGEYFMERGRFFHGKDVYHELVHVPLIISGAIDKHLHGNVIEQPVEVSSIPRTIMDIIGLKNHRFGGKDLLASAKEPKENEQPVFTEGNYAWGKNHRKKSILFQGWKLIQNRDSETYEFYNTNKDWNEQQERWNDVNPDVVELKMSMKEILEQFPQKQEIAASELEFDENDLEHLRSLGYVQ